MAQKISQMTEQTTASMTEAGTSDFLGGYTATGGNANRKFSLSGLANYFLNKFKMTLGGSSQTVKSAIDALNSKVTTITIPANSDLNDYISPGIYGQNSTSAAATITNTPVNTAFLLEVLLLQPSTSGIWLGALQRLTDLTGHYIYVRRMYTNGSGQWSFGSWYNFTGTQVS